MGKPAEFMLANIAAKFKLRRNQICMVGDRLDTDILFGQHGGLTTMLVLSGSSRPLGAVILNLKPHLSARSTWTSATEPVTVRHAAGCAAKTTHDPLIVSG